MKNIIAITSLLAAGTLCANAAVELPDESSLLFTFDYSTTSDTPQVNNSSWGWEHWGTETPSIADGVANFSNGGPYTNADVSFDPGAFTLTFDISKVTNTTEGVVFAYGKGCQGSNRFYVSVTENSIALIDSTAVTYDTYNFTGGLVTVLEATNIDLTGDTFKNVVVSNSSSGSFISVDGVVVASDENCIASVESASSRFGIGSIFGGGTGKLNGTLDNVSFYGSASTIPEPSAFGLLAGLGALALAGTRRRRRK